MRRLLKTFVVFLLLSPMAAMAAEPYKEGVQYFRLDTPVPTKSGNNIEVAEAFWYG
ncbi:hypothetical protein [Sansalvadorimonas verongulae]|uniref:hypothetical protein n=1 Tax=Sansalvadorimonas verongulae TaxID=2172824 RepID=UPI0012BCAA40|nr:hypothetical protein [Sansalvadorimonas verongulae]